MYTYAGGFLSDSRTHSQSNAPKAKSGIWTVRPTSTHLIVRTWQAMCQKCLTFSRLRSQRVRIPSPATLQGHTAEVPSLLVAVKEYEYKQSIPCGMVIYSVSIQNAFNKYHYIVMYCPMIPLAAGDKVCSPSFNPKTVGCQDDTALDASTGKVSSLHLSPNCHNFHQAADQRLLIRLWP